MAFKTLCLSEATFMLNNEMDESIKPLIIVFSISGKTIYFESKITSKVNFTKAIIFLEFAMLRATAREL